MKHKIHFKKHYTNGARKIAFSDWNINLTSTLTFLLYYLYQYFFKYQYSTAKRYYKRNYTNIYVHEFSCLHRQDSLLVGVRKKYST